jgi:hypothetical protein
LTSESRAENAVEPERQTGNRVGKDRGGTDAQLRRDDLVAAFAVVTNLCVVHDLGAGGELVVHYAAPAKRRFDAGVDLVEDDSARSREGRQRAGVADRNVVDGRRVGNVDQRIG